MYKSNAEWDKSVYVSQYGDGISTDTHDTKEQAEAVCMHLELNGFGGMRKDFPIKTWVEEVEDEA